VTSLPPTSVYQRVLGEDFALLAPELHNYFSLPPDGMVGRATGVFDVVGSRRRWMRPALRFLAWRRILFPDFGRGVPFRAINIPGPGDGLSALREIDFPATMRLMEDTMHVIDGRLHDFLGRTRSLEVRFRLRVVDGGLLMVSDGNWVHIGRLRMPLPSLLGAKVVLSERWETDAQRVVLTLSHPLFGDLFEYSGRFTYVYE
jgi:hypothetical protein